MIFIGCIAQLSVHERQVGKCSWICIDAALNRQANPLVDKVSAGPRASRPKVMGLTLGPAGR